jgi:hypothetical protein
MMEVKFVHPYEGDYHRACIETSSGIPVAEVGVTVDEEIYFNCMNALELYLKAKFAENMMEVMGTLLEIGLTDSVRKMIGDMCIMSRDDEIALQEAFEFRVMREMIMNID